jgi:hypothetical protein
VNPMPIQHRLHLRPVSDLVRISAKFGKWASVSRWSCRSTHKVPRPAWERTCRPVSDDALAPMTSKTGGCDGSPTLSHQRDTAHARIICALKLVSLQPVHRSANTRFTLRPDTTEDCPDQRALVGVIRGMVTVACCGRPGGWRAARTKPHRCWHPVRAFDDCHISVRIPSP